MFITYILICNQIKFQKYTSLIALTLGFCASLIFFIHVFTISEKLKSIIEYVNENYKL